MNDIGRSTLISRLPVAALMLAAVLFGVASTGTKFSLGGFGPVTVLAVELLFATAVLWTLLLRRGGIDGRYVWAGWFCWGLLEPGLAYLLFSFGLDRTSASNGALASGLESGFVVILAAVFLREKAGGVMVTAIGLAVVGMVVLEGEGRFAGPGLGDLLIAGGTLSAAGYTILARGLAPQDDSRTVTAHQFAVGSALVLPLAIFQWTTGAELPPTAAGVEFWVAAALVGTFGFGASFLLYNSAIVNIAAGPAGVIINLAPAFGLASAVLWLGEELTSARLVGAVLIALSVAMFVTHERRNLTHERRNLLQPRSSRASNRLSRRWS